MTLTLISAIRNDLQVKDNFIIMKYRYIKPAMFFLLLKEFIGHGSRMDKFLDVKKRDLADRQVTLVI